MKQNLRETVRKWFEIQKILFCKNMENDIDRHERNELGKPETRRGAIQRSKQRKSRQTKWKAPQAPQEP